MRRLSQGVDRDSQTGQIVEWNSKRFGLRTYIWPENLDKH
jgi:hypothetical protein